jgi:hypothetical protein
MKAKAAQIERISTLEAVDMIDSPNTQVERASDDELRCVQTESIGPVCPNPYKDSRRIGEPFHKIRIRMRLRLSRHPANTGFMVAGLFPYRMLTSTRRT